MFTDPAQQFQSPGNLGKTIILKKGSIIADFVYDDIIFGMLSSDLPSIDLTFGQELPPRLIKASLEKHFLID